MIIIPVQLDSTESFAIPINVDLLIMVAKALDEMVSMFFADVFDAKIVHDKAKTDGAPLVAPESWRVADWCVAIGVEETCQLLFREDAGLRKTVHAASYLDVDFAIVYQVSEFVVCDDFVGDGVDRDEHVLVIIHWCTEIVILYIQTEPTCPRGRECTVDEYFEGGHVGDFHAEVAGVIDEVASHGDSGAVTFSFLWAIAADKSGICGSPVFGDFVEGNEKYCVGGFDTVVWETLCEAPELVGG